MIFSTSYLKVHSNNVFNPSLSFREEVKNVKIWFLNHNFMSDITGATNTYEAQSKNMINICTKYGFDGLIISGGYGGHR